MSEITVSRIEKLARDVRDGWFVNAKKRARLEDPDLLELHDLRDSAASLAISAGANVKACNACLVTRQPP